jgi:hypothetical protein
MRHPLDQHRRRDTLSVTDLGGSLLHQIALAIVSPRSNRKVLSVAILNFRGRIGPDLSRRARQTVDEFSSGSTEPPGGSPAR